jgi:hypothetical protein
MFGWFKSSNDPNPTIGQLVVMLAKNNRRAYRLLGDDVVGRHGLSVRVVVMSAVECESSHVTSV